MSRYTKQHYEDVARILHKYYRGIAYGPDYSPGIAKDFADLFATANPPICRLCGANPGDDTSAGHDFIDGFNRIQFLAACGLEPDTIPIDEASEAVEPPHRYG